jgi:hypothetical protein
MPKDEKDQQTEQTRTGFKVPVPKRNEFFANLKRAAKPDLKRMSSAPQNRGKGSRRMSTPRGNAKGK